MQILLFTIGFILMFIVSSHFSGHHEGHKREKGLYFNIGEYTLYIHHWIWMSILLILGIYLQIINIFIVGILLGGIVEGFTYRDRFIVFYKTKDFEKIYKKFETPHWGIHLRRQVRILKVKN